jgi:thiol-disulfide isomerase/thioredoxin
MKFLRNILIAFAICIISVEVCGYVTQGPRKLYASATTRKIAEASRTCMSSTEDNSEGGSMLPRKVTAALSSILGGGFFFYQLLQPVSGVDLLRAMEKDSEPLNSAVCSSKPTIIDFYAPWCESCKAVAPSMRAAEIQYKNDVNFITIDGSDPRNSDMVTRFRVDGIPHIAFLSPNEEVKTALVGAVPKQLLFADISALAKNEPLPIEGYDAFEEESHFPLKDVSKSCSLSVSESSLQQPKEQ